MTRFRHPCIFQVVEPLVESPTMLAFASERAICTIADFLQNPSSDFATTYKFGEIELDELDIQVGLLQVVKGLEFLHSNLIVHVIVK